MSERSAENSIATVNLAESNLQVLGADSSAKIAASDTPMVLMPNQIQAGSTVVLEDSHANESISSPTPAFVIPKGHQESQLKLTPASAAKDIDTWHCLLDVNFRTLSNDRKSASTKVYILEHDLPPEALTQMRALVSVVLKTKAMTNKTWWYTRYLPLLVLAVEQGYAYRGNGTDFWHAFGAHLQSEIDHEARRALSGYFELANNQYGTIRPPQTDWSIHFCHIAWPITHAVLPLDMRIPLAEGLLELGAEIDHFTDDELIYRLSLVRSPSWSRRYGNWLMTDSGIAAAFVRLILKNTQFSLLTSSTKQRIHHDLIEESLVRKAAQRAARPATIPNGQDPERVKRLEASLYLKRTTEFSFRLYMQLPSVPNSGRDWLLRQLRSGRWVPKPWGENSWDPIPISVALSSSLFEIPQKWLAGQRSEEFYVGWRELSPSPELSRWLSSVSVSLSLPRVFQIDKAGEPASQQRLGRVSPRDTLWVLADDSDTTIPDDATPIGKMGTRTVFLFDPAIKQVASWLNDRGYLVDQTIVWKRLHDCRTQHLSSVSSIGQFQGYKIDKVGEVSKLSVTVRRCGEITEFPITESGIYGEITASNETCETQLTLNGEVLDRWSVGIVDDTVAPPVFNIRLLGGDGTITAFWENQIALQIVATRDIQNVPVTLSFGGTREVISVADFPLHIGPGHHVWKKLKSKQVINEVARGSDLRFTVTVAGCEENSWLFENELSQVMWSFDAHDVPSASTDDECLSVIRYSIDRIPARRLSPGAVPSEATLSVVLKDEEPQFHLGVVVSGSRSSKFPMTPVIPERIERKLLSTSSSSVGLEELVDQYIAFVTARSPHLVSALHSNKYKQTLWCCILDTLCGKQWGEYLRQQQEQYSQPLFVLVRIAEKHSIGFERKFHEFDGVNDTLRHEVMSELATTLPVGWWRYPMQKFTADSAAKFDDAFRDAYRSAAYTVTADETNTWEKAEPFTDIDKYRSVVTEAIRLLNGGHLATLLMPLSGGDDLIESPMELTSVEEMTEMLVDWRKRFISSQWSSAIWDIETLQTAVQLFHRPQSLRSGDWTNSVELLLRDRNMSRIISFVSWHLSHLLDHGG